MTTQTSNGAGQNASASGLVAVIGMGCVLPDAHDIPTFWENLKNGKSSIREVPKERWDPDLYWSPDAAAPDKTYSKIGSFVTGFRFDPMKFRIPPKVLKSLDESQLWALEAAQQCLADAGYDKKEFDRTRCAVILGNAMGGESRTFTTIRLAYPAFEKAVRGTPAFGAMSGADQARLLSESEGRFKASLPEITEDTMPGELSNVIAGRIANVLNLSGKNFTTDAACASSLAAIDAAAKSLVYGEADMVLTGGVDRSQDVGSYIKFCKIGALSANGSFPFDARADGFVMGEGAAMLLLKRYEDAVRDGDRVYAVFRGVGSSSDGKGKGITAPNPEGQLKSVHRAFLDAQVPPSEIDLLECHGTSTKVGDAVEVQVLNQIFGPYVAQKQSIPIGSVKSNIGHLKSAAGGAGILKVILALHHKTLPPSINYQSPNPSLKLETTPFFVNATTRPWPEPANGRPRRGGISSFGFGGTNFHVIVEEYAPGKNVPKTTATTSTRTAPTPTKAAGVASVLLSPTPHHASAEPLAPAGATDVLVLGAATAAELEQEIRAAQEHLAANVTPGTFHGFLHGRRETALSRQIRVALVVDSPKDAAAKLSDALEAVRDPKKRPLLANKGIHVGEGRPQGKVAFLFPGQGSQYADMLRDLATRYESVRRTLDDADRVMVPLVGKPLTSFLFSNEKTGRGRDQVEEDLKRTEITQPAVLAADASLFRLLGDHGVRPDLVAGHSLGEYGALVAAGVLTFEDALLAVSARGREMANVHVPDLGKMASVSAPTHVVEAKLKSVEGYVIPANKNCNVQTVIAGASPAVEAAVQMFSKEGIAAQFIPVSAAFHSRIVAPATEPMRRVLERLDVREPKIPVLSNVHADYYATGPQAREKAIELLSRQVAAPVEWQRQIERMHADGARLFVEIGPKSVLTTFVKNILEGRPHAAIATNHPKKGGFFHLNDTLAFLSAVGYPVRFPRPDDATFHLPAFREILQALAQPAPVAKPPLASAPTAGVTALAFPNLQQAADQFIREKQEELRRVLTEQFQQAPTPPSPVPTAAVADPALLEIKKRVEALGLNLEPVLITGVSVGTPGTTKKLFDDRNFERILAGENAIEPLSPEERQAQVDKNVVRLVKSSTGDPRFEAIRDVAEVIKLAGKKGQFDFEKDYGIGVDFADALDITSKMAIAAGIEALRDAQIPLVRGYVKTTTGKYLPGEWALPEPLQHETGVIFCSVWPGVAKIVDYVSQNLTNQYARRSTEERRTLYRDLVAVVRDPATRAELESWCDRHEQEIVQNSTPFYEFNRRFLFHVLSMGHSQTAQFIRAKGPNTQINAACSTTTQAVGIAEDWIRTGRCKRILIVGADDITGPEMLEYWAAGFLAAGAATTEGDVTKAALPFDRRRHGMIIGVGAVGIVVEAESVVKARGMEGITEVVATSFLNSAYHGSRIDTEHVAKVMDDLVATVERRTGTSRRDIASSMLFMSHETYTPARGGSAAAEIESLTKTFGPDVSKVIVANTKGFTGHPMAVGIEDAIAIRCLQTGRVPPIANLREPDPSLGNITLSRGGSYDLQYGLRLGAGFGSQIAMYVMKLRSKDATRILDRAAYLGWVARVSGSRTPELEVVNRTLRVKAQLPTLEAAKPSAPAAPPRPLPPIVAPIAAPKTVAPAPTSAAVLQRVIDLVAEKTGYPRDMLEPDLELEADLGIDTVKQAELFGLIRETYRVPRDDALQLKDVSTLNKIATYIAAGAAAAAGAGAIAAVAPAVVAAAPIAASAASAPLSVGRSQVFERLVQLVAEKTGYTRDLLEPDLELEADLGIDTVKQAEIFGLVRQEFAVERDDNLQLKDYPTLNKIADYLHSRIPGTVPATPAPIAPAIPTPVPAGPTPTPKAPAPEAAADQATILVKVRSLVAEKTGYPIDMLDPDLDLEADLGIDTVKQAEIFGIIRESYGIAQRDDVQLKDYNTLNKLAGFMLQNMATPAAGPAAATVAAAPIVAPIVPVAPVPVPPTHRAPAAAGDKAAVLDQVRALVAEKTGYPIDMLDPELDLEADLGIDTVKQAELFGMLRESHGIARRDDVQLKDYNTLSKLADFILQNSGPAATLTEPAAIQALVAETPTPAAAPIVPRTTHRYIVRYVRANATPSDPDALQGKVLLVWGPPAYRTEATNALQKAGATTLALDALPGRLEEAQAIVDEHRRGHGRVNGLVFVPTPNAQGSRYEASDAGSVKSLFYLIKALLAGAKSAEVDTVAVATFLGGDFAATTRGPINPLEGGLVGMAKAVARELPNATVKAIDFSAHTLPDAVAKTLTEELGRRDGLVEVGSHGGRGLLKLLEQETVEEEPGVELTSRDVVLVSGGGAGITGEILKRLAQTSGAGFAILGRTPLHTDAARFAAFTEREWNGKRVEVQSELKARGERVTPVAVDRALAPLRKSAEIHANLETLRAAGARADYYAVDVTAADAVQRVAQQVRRTLGPVTGILHAAGIEESKLIVDKTPESFDRVFDVKVLGARALLDATADDPLRFFIAFTSIAGRFGNAGQADYSAANDALAKLSSALRADRGPDFPATAIDWSAWDEKGMATRGSVMTVLKEAGVTAIPLQEGVQRFADELAHGLREPEIIVAGELGRLAPPDAFTNQAEAVPIVATPMVVAEAAAGNGAQYASEEPPGEPNLITNTIQGDGRTATATLVLDPAADPYLRDHAVDGVPYLPGVFGMEAFAEVAAKLSRGLPFVGARDVEFRLPVKVLRDRPLEVTIVASVATESDDRIEIGCRLQSIFTNAKGERLGAPRIHFTGTLLFDRRAPTATPPPGPGGDLERIIEAKEIYQQFFHGPSFQVLDRVAFEVDGKTTIGLWGDPRAKLFGDRSARFLTMPMMRELAYQTAGCYELFKNRHLALPKGEARLKFHKRVPENTALRAHATFKGLRENVTHFDIVAATPDGEVLFEIQDFELIRIKPLDATNGAPTATVATMSPVPMEITYSSSGGGAQQSLYKSRWGHDLPLPLAGAVGVQVDQRDLAQTGVTDGASLTSGERADQQRFRNDKRAREFFAGRLAAKEAIAQLLGRPVREARGIEIRRLETGEPQPRGTGLEGVLVSITHTGDVALAAAALRGSSVRTLGVDAELIEEKPAAFESEAFTDAEKQLLDSLVAQGRKRGETQIRFWAVKEAVLKALGKGFALSVKDVRVTRVEEDERVAVELAGPARKVLVDLGGGHVTVQTWLRGDLVYALAWIHG